MEPYAVNTDDDCTEKANMQKDSIFKPEVDTTSPAGFHTDANKVVIIIGAF